MPLKLMMYRHLAVIATVWHIQHKVQTQISLYRSASEQLEAELPEVGHLTNLFVPHMNKLNM